MATLEQLQQDNVKLQERLNNAAKFFKEQKAQIDTLTQTNKELQDQVDKFANLNSQLNEYELKLQSIEALTQDQKAQIDTLTQANKELQNQVDSCEFNAECDSDVIADYRGKLESLEAQLKEQADNYEREITSLQEANIKLGEKANLLDECSKKLTNLEEAYETLRTKYQNVKENHNEDLVKLEEQNKQIIELTEKIESKDKFINELQKTYNNVFAENTQLKKQLESNNDGNVKAVKYDKLVEAIKKLIDENVSQSSIEINENFTKVPDPTPIVKSRPIINNSNADEFRPHDIPMMNV